MLCASTAAPRLFHWERLILWIIPLAAKYLSLVSTIGPGSHYERHAYHPEEHRNIHRSSQSNQRNYRDGRHADGSGRWTLAGICGLQIRPEVLAHFIPSFALDSIPVSTAHRALGGEHCPRDGYHPVPDCPVFGFLKTKAVPATSNLADQLESRPLGFGHSYVISLVVNVWEAATTSISRSRRSRRAPRRE